MKTVTCNNRIGSRSLRHVNLLLCPDMGIVEFKGTDIPPVLRVLKEEYTKDGKWSHSTWTVELEDDYELLSYSQDWEMGTYFPVRTWEEAIKRLDWALERKPTKMGISDEMLARAVRAIFPKSAAEIDAAEAEFTTAGNVLAELLAAQAELAEAKKAESEMVGKIYQMEEADELRQEAARTRYRVDTAKALLEGGGKVSLAAIKAAIGI